MPRTLLQTVAILWMLVVFTGCPRNADNTVTLVLQGDSNLGAQIAEHLTPALLDKADWSHISWFQWGSGNTKITLAPIADPESLRQRIYFGDITRIDGRTVYIKVDRLRGPILIIYTRTKTLLQILIWPDKDE